MYVTIYPDVCMTGREIKEFRERLEVAEVRLQLLR